MVQDRPSRKHLGRGELTGGALGWRTGEVAPSDVYEAEGNVADGCGYLWCDEDWDRLGAAGEKREVVVAIDGLCSRHREGARAQALGFHRCCEIGPMRPRCKVQQMQPRWFALFLRAVMLSVERNERILVEDETIHSMPE